MPTGDINTAKATDIIRLTRKGKAFFATLAQAGSVVTLPHAPSHETGGLDEIDVTGLFGLLADEQNPLAHAADHENGGSDELDVTGLSGLLIDEQNPLAHATDHESGGSDEINVGDLRGDTKSINIEDPAASDDITFFHATRAALISQINFVLTGATDATVTIRHGPDRSAAGTEVITGGTVVDQLDDQEVTVFNSASITAGDWLWIEITAITGTPDSVTMSVTF